MGGTRVFLLYLIEISVVEFCLNFFLLKIQFIDIFRSKFILLKCVTRSKNDLIFFWIDINGYYNPENICVFWRMCECVWPIIEQILTVFCHYLHFFQFSHFNFFITFIIVCTWTSLIHSFFSLQTKTNIR